MLYTRFGRFLTLLVLSLLAAAPGAWADLTAAERYLVEWETQSNPTVRKSSHQLDLLHYEIPLELVASDLSEQFPPEARGALIFERDGKEYVRWVIHPDDDWWHLKVADFLRGRGLGALPKRGLTGYYTASRSLIVEDPKSGKAFGLKVSTNKTGGFWNMPKNQRWNDAQKIRAVDKMFREAKARHTFKYFDVMHEAGAFGIEDLNQAMVVRSLEGIAPSKGFRYLPAFAAFDEVTGTAIAEVNGSNDPAAFWNEHLNKPLARALAELATHFGVVYNSPHSQNFLIELDANHKPTGRIILRDFADLYISSSTLKDLGLSKVSKRFPLYLKRLTRSISMSVALLHGTYAPHWMKPEVYKHWGREFFGEFEKTLSSLVGAPPRELAGGGPKVVPLAVGGEVEGDGAWFSKRYDLSGRRWAAFRRAFAVKVGWVKLPEVPSGCLRRAVRSIE